MFCNDVVFLALFFVLFVVPRKSVCHILNFSSSGLYLFFVIFRASYLFFSCHVSDLSRVIALFSHNFFLHPF